MNSYEHLFSPIQIGTTTVKNRVFMPPISTNLADKGYVTDELVEHYAARAKGGVGLIITEVTTVEPTYIYLPGDMSICDDSYIPGWKKLTDAVHKYGAKILPQLFHPAYMAFPIPGTPQLIAPSNVGPYYAKEAPRAVTIEELKVIIRQFGEAAFRVKQAGGDGVEIHAAHAHGLLGGFLSPLYNKRTDAYGGDIHGRLRLTLEVIEEVRKMCGKDFIIDVRISGDEYTDGGQNLNDAVYVAKQLEKAGVDFIHVSGGTTIMRGSSIPAPGTPLGSHSKVGEEIKKQVSIPVATVGRITEPWFAEELIANGKADICMIGRANLCDPEFVQKACEGREDEIRPCIGCLRCLNGIMFGKRVACTVNPSLELENEDNIPAAQEKKQVLVIGGGPAGMEAAFVAKKRGHEVVLCEKSDSLGGLVKLAAVPIAKQELTKVIQYMERKLTREGVEILLNCEVTEEMLKNEFAGYEVIAGTGADPIVVNAFTAFKHCVTADDILAGKAFAGRKVVVIGGGSVGCETADYLAPLVNDLFPRNREIILLEMADGIMLQESGPGRSLLTQRMMKKGIQIHCKAKVEKVEAEKIYYTENGEEHCISDADTLVLAMGYRPDSKLEETLKKANVSYHLIGDAKKVGNIKDAITEGYQIAREI
ncbi:2,4-dienoyl-CoA reductase-like NADH-dependent reductase (Old Yellow Enzyme family) [Faecalimonas umbilicata]|uniref:2,4-dienoyl-CoA reductase-like NADH-dependent reductase (Old Yellow Enzyme family) n=1 Tax=Faecalimonas umbilicata TaxID=1912855 RepID=A0A4R3JQR5_9FIRM|nr:FAD-dependent oxidoreductase [Faecalimonas umbilicata]TCS69260.1 2,4-dienoyl-CoA reductase-like NADH-dependent reductase (Old Yellow Enzyme family) [Faecalimonas umbilicata]GBU06211.1 oxidoreductase [Faecalimonas umbilicata]